MKSDMASDTKRRMVSSGPRRGFPSLLIISGRLINAAFLWPPSRINSAFRAAVSDSGSRNRIVPKFSKAMPAAANAGTAKPHWLSTPPITGPTMKPRPNAAPIMPIPWVRLLSSVTSAM